MAIGLIRIRDVIDGFLYCRFDAEDLNIIYAISLLSSLSILSFLPV